MPDTEAGAKAKRDLGNWGGTWGESGHLLPNKTVAQVGDSNYSSPNIGSVLHMKSSWAKSSKSAWKEGKPAFRKALALPHREERPISVHWTLPPSHHMPTLNIIPQQPILKLITKDSIPCKITRIPGTLNFSLLLHTHVLETSHGIRSLMLQPNTVRF